MSNQPYLEPDKLWRYCRAPFRIMLYILVVYFIFFRQNYMNSDDRCSHSLFTCSHGNLRFGARNNVGSMNRAQQAYFLESQKFGVTMGDIGLGIPTENDNYSYRVVQPMQPVSDWKQPNSVNWVMTIGQAKHNKLTSYFGFVWFETDPTTKEKTTKTILCETVRKSATHGDFIAMPKMIDGQMQCPPDYKNIGN